MSVAVFTDLEAYRVAAAELPESVRLADEPTGAVVVLGGERWADAAERAIRAGAAAIVVRRPGPVHAETLGRLSEAGIPIVLERPLARADAVAAARATLDDIAPFAAVVVECHAPADALGDALRDAVAWTRILLGEEVGIASASFDGGGGVALLGTSSGVSASLLAAVSPGAPPRGRLRATGLGVTLVEVEVDEHRRRVAVSDALSQRILPPHFEAPERVALRRAAAAAVAAGERLADLEEFAHDEAVVAALGSGRIA